MNRALVRRRAGRHARRQKERTAQKRRAAAVLEGEPVLAGEVDEVLPPGHPWAQLLATVPKTSPEDDQLLAGDSEAEPPPAR